jgi:hypothetical protein
MFAIANQLEAISRFSFCSAEHCHSTASFDLDPAALRRFAEELTAS